MNKICTARGCNNPSSKEGNMCSACQNKSKNGGNPHLWSESCPYKPPYGCMDYILNGNCNCRKCMTEKERYIHSPMVYEEEYDRIAEQAYQHELDRDLELDREYEANMPLSPSGAGIVYGGSDDIPF